MKNLKRFLCIVLTMAMIFLLPGMTHIVSAATRESSETDNTVTMTTENQISGQPLEAVSANRDLAAEYESGIWKQSASDVSVQGIALASSTETQNPPDMMYALRKVNPVFSSKNNNNESIDLNKGSLNLSYPLASMAGVNGMDLSLSLNYSSASANTLDKGYIDYEQGTDGLFHYKGITAEKPISVAEKGLGYGWYFNIPHIRKMTDFDSEGRIIAFYSTIILDNGKSIALEADMLCSFDLTEEHNSEELWLISGYNDYQYDGITATFENQTVTHVLSYKDGTKYYFDENDICVGKEDRFGNMILYTYANGKLTSITDNFERSITLNWGTDHVDVTASDGSSVRINIGENAVSSISYNDTETSTFSYLIQNTAFGTQETQIPHILLTGITHPNQHISVYEYEKNSVSRPDYTTEQLFQLKKRYDVVNGIQKNTINYSYAGNHLSNYSNINSIFVQNHSGNNIWSRNGIDYDKYALISNYHTTVSDGISETTYYFNPNARCNSIEVKENGVLLSVRESLYDCDKLIATRETLSDTSGDAMSYFTVYTYDTLKNIVSVKKFQSGNSIYYEETASYDNPYSLITSSSVNGFVTNYTYSSDNKTLSSVEVREDEVLREKSEYTYLSNGNIKTEKVYILPGSTTVTTTYHYGANDTGIFPTSSVTDSIKDSDGNAKSNITLSATYDIAGRVLSETDGNGNTTSYTYDSRGRLIQTDYPDGTYETVTYDIPNRKTTNRNRAGYTQIHQYDENGNLLSVKESDETLLASYTYDIRGRVLTERIYQTATTWRETRYTYDALDRPLTVKNYDENNSLLSSESYVYNVVSLNGETLFKTTKTVLGDSNSPTSKTSEYKDVYGRTVRSGGMFDGEEFAKTFTYDNLDRVLTETDELGKTTTYTYDYAGNVLTATDASGATVTYTYDSMGNMLTMKDAKNTTVTYTYDVLGRQLTQTVPFTASAAQVTKYDYDANGNVTMTRVSRDASSFTKTENTYDSMNRLTKTESYNGTTIALTTEYTYNAYDQPLTMEIGNSTTVYEYNTRGEQTKITDARNQNETFSYDLGGNLVIKTDRNGTTFTYVYDRLGRLLSETAVNGATTEQRAYAYSLTGAIVSETNGTVTITRKYDVLGRLIEETETSADGTAVSRYAYTKRGEKERYALTLDGEEIISEYYEYDDLGRLWKVYDSVEMWGINDGVYVSSGLPTDFSAYPHLPIYIIPGPDMQSDSRYRLVPLNAPTDDFPLTCMKGDTLYGICFEEPTPYAGTVGYGESMVYVYYNNVICEQYQISLNGSLSTVLYGYYILDENRNVVRSIAIIDENIDAEIPTFEVMVLDDHIDFDQYMTGYSLRSAGATETLVATYTYDANGNRTSLTYANGTTTTYAYNQANLVTSVLNKKGSTTLSSHSYTYYLDGNIASENENGTSKTYEYDGLGRLTKETKNGTITMYTYDANGNRATMTQNGVTTTYTYDDNNRLTAETVAGVATTYTYDNNGNLINAWNGGNPVGTYAYNLFGNQVSYTPNGVLYTSYAYRPDGLRHSIGDKVHLWDGANIVADVDGNDVVVYFRGINLIYADDGDITYYHFNAHGDVVVLTNASGTKTKSYSYNAFGVEYNESTLDDNPFRYCGEYYDKETKTIYLRARYYNAEQGRFTQQDGWEYANPQDPLSLNLYTYCWNNPIQYMDPFGHDIKAQKDKICFDADGMGAGLGIIAAIVASTLIDGVIDGCENAYYGITEFFSEIGDNIVDFFEKDSLITTIPASKLSGIVFGSTYEKNIKSKDAKLRNKVLHSYGTRYWTATIHEDYVSIGRALTYDEAVQEIKQGHNVFTVTSREALALALTASANNSTLEPQNHARGKNTKGYYWHFHTKPKNGGHVFYLTP